MDKKIKSILQDAAEQEVPASEVSLWSGVKARLVAGNYSFVQQGEKMNSVFPRRMQRLAFAVLAIAALLAIAFITPQGRAFAQDILKLFQRADSNVFPVSPDQIASVQAESVPTVVPPAPLITISDAYQVVGFDFRVPETPQGFELLGARANATSISIEYEAKGGGGALILQESSQGFVELEWNQAPVAAISQVKIGDIDAEIVQGTFVVYPGETVARWNPNASVLRLRWTFDGVWFEMSKFGDVQSIQSFDRDAMLQLAEKMIKGPFTLSVQEAESLAGYDVLEPAWLPPVLFFEGAAFEPKEWDNPKDAVLISYYFSSANAGPGLASNGIVITQQPVASIEGCTLGTGCLVGVGATIETVQIGGAAGEYVIGVWQADNAGNWVWIHQPYLQRLRWQNGDMAFEILYMGPPEYVTKSDLIAIAESMQ